MLNRCWRHFKTIIKHKWYVLIECCKMGIPWRGVLHDLSKFSPSEFVPSARYFQGTSSPIEAEREAVGYSYAWRHHKGINRHHWQWYVDDDGVDERGIIRWNAAPMPDKYLKEMYCDMVGAGKAYGGEMSVKEYYLSKRHGWLLHPETKAKFEEMLGIPQKKEMARTKHNCGKPCSWNSWISPCGCPSTCEECPCRDCEYCKCEKDNHETVHH